MRVKKVTMFGLPLRSFGAGQSGARTWSVISNAYVIFNPNSSMLHLSDEQASDLLRKTRSCSIVLVQLSSPNHG